MIVGVHDRAYQTARQTAENEVGMKKEMPLFQGIKSSIDPAAVDSCPQVKAGKSRFSSAVSTILGGQAAGCAS